MIFFSITLVKVNEKYNNFDSCKKSANYVAKKLENKGIILRSMENYKMKNKLRMTIGSTAQNKKFIKEFV